MAMTSSPPSISLTGFSPAFLLFEKVKTGEIDPYHVDIELLIREFEKKAQELKDYGFFSLAGEFLLALCKLLKFKLEYFFPTPPKPERKRITIQEVQNILELEEETTPFEFQHLVRVGRPQGSKNTPKPKETSETPEEHVPLHKAFSIEDYIKILTEKNLTTFNTFEAFFHSIPSPIERVRFFMAWLNLTSH
jgi:chromatin segregation and condensation protein Rec8/ScpA/Scc1 (kleisin family)